MIYSKLAIMYYENKFDNYKTKIKEVKNKKKIPTKEKKNKKKINK